MTAVSVIITTCDRPETLETALVSVRAQTFDDLEIIVCDDASDERTAEVVLAHARHDSRIAYRRSDIRLGQRGTVLRGLQEASGEMLAICHDDDCWEPVFLSRTTAVMREYPQVVAVFSDHFIIDERGRVDLEATEANTRRWKTRRPGTWASRTLHPTRTHRPVTSHGDGDANEIVSH